MDADQYRERPTEEITREQKELERLRRQVILRGGAWWEFRQDAYVFGVSEEWTELTGYVAEDIFPLDLDPVTNPVEPKLDNLIDKFCAMVDAPDRAQFKVYASDFLLWTQKSKVFDSGFRLVAKDKKPIAVWAVAHSVWEGGRLQSLFCQIRSLEGLMQPLPSAVAIARNTDDLQITSGSLKNILGHLSKLKIWLPLAVVGAAGFNDALALGIKEVTRFIEIISMPIRSAKTPRTLGEDTLPEKVTAETLAEAREAMKDYARLGVVTLSVYDRGQFPAKFRPIIQATSRQDVLFGGDASPISTSVSAQIANMTDTHMIPKDYELLTPESYIFSIPIQVTRLDGTIQTFFIEVESMSKDDGRRNEIRSEVSELSAIIKEILIR